MKRTTVVASARRRLVAISVRKFIPRMDVKATLLRIESCLTIPFFIVTWLVSAIGFAVRAGFLMAKADDELKSKILDHVLKPKRRQ